MTGGEHRRLERRGRGSKWRLGVVSPSLVSGIRNDCSNSGPTDPDGRLLEAPSHPVRKRACIPEAVVYDAVFDIWTELRPALAEAKDDHARRDRLRRHQQARLVASGGRAGRDLAPGRRSNSDRDRVLTR
jgi:hypothetical protein